MLANQAELNDSHLSKDLLEFERDRKRTLKRKDRRKGKNSTGCTCCRAVSRSHGKTLQKGSVNLRWLSSFDEELVLGDTSDWNGVVEVTRRSMPILCATLLDIARPARPTKLKGLAKDFIMIPSLPQVLDWEVPPEAMPVPVDDWELL